MSAASQSETDLLVEVQRYKSMYEQEREQLEEFQHYSKELEAEMDAELALYKKKASEAETKNRQLQQELDEIKRRQDNERNDFLANESSLKMQLASCEATCVDLKQKLRKVEQLNDDFERKERIQSQELTDWAVRYEKCLERCAFLEAGMLSGEDDSMAVDTAKAGDAEETRISSSTANSSISDVTSSLPSDEHGRVFAVTPSSHGVSESRQRAFSVLSTADCRRDDGIVSPPVSRMRLDCDNSPSGDGLYVLGKESRRSSEIVSSLFRKIEEVEKQVNPKKYVIHRTPNRSK